MTDYSLTIEQARALLQTGPHGDDFSVPDNARPDQHVHARRVGEPGSKKGARVAVVIHGEHQGQVLVSVIAAPQARMLAAALLNAADEIDGETPLVFHPARYVAREDLDDPTVQSDVIEVAKEAFIADLGRTADLATLAQAEEDEVEDSIRRTAEEAEAEEGDE